MRYDDVGVITAKAQTALEVGRLLLKGQRLDFVDGLDALGQGHLHGGLHDDFGA